MYGYIVHATTFAPMHKIVTLLLVCFSSLVFGQEVILTGQCVDLDKKGMVGVRLRVNESKSAIFTDESGIYSVKANVGDSLSIEYYYQPEKITQTSRFFVKDVGLNNIPTIVFNVRTQFVGPTTVIGEIEKPFELDPIKLRYDILPVMNIERSLIFTTAATSSNELTSNYNVRGGSYEENLVYVNGFEIYRPFLTRAGQQEGMSFINSALVEALRFSGGGFDARYGDKLSSVLDIDYRKADTLRGSIMASMLGVEGSFEQQLGKRKRFNYMFGARYRSNGYFLNSLPAKGAYNPVFWDAQLLTNYTINEKLDWSILGHVSSNNYLFAPQTQQTDFGVAQEAYRFNIYFDGQEQTKFRTITAGTKLRYEPNKKTELNFFASFFNTDEREYFDVQGQYFLNELETDPNQENFGDSIGVLGVGTFLNHARNRLRANIYSVYHTGKRSIFKGYVDNDRMKFREKEFHWGVKYQHNDFFDILSEWKMIDSAGYSIPQGSPTQVELLETIKGKLNLQSDWVTGHLQYNQIWAKSKKNYVVTLSKKIKNKKDKTHYIRTLTDTIANSANRWAMAIGTRAGYTTVNQEFYVTPRASIMYYPRAYMMKDSNIVRRDMTVRFSTGLYYQPPFYRDLRRFDGTLNLDVKAQKSYHAVLGYDMFFNMWGRSNPFKFTTELYYKYLWDVNAFEVENVRTRYFANNDAVAYAYGIDMMMHGEFIRGIESYFKIGLLSTKENLLNDQYTEYYNAAGEAIIFGISDDQTVVDSALIKPGYIPRPTDQRLNIGVLIQDQMPGLEALSAQVGIQFGTGLPFGPPDRNRYKDTLRLKEYFRVDIGTSYDFLYKKKEKKTFISRNFTQAILSLEVYNLLGINNELSKQWIQGTNGTQYAVPNYLTQRRINLKLIVRF